MEGLRSATLYSPARRACKTRLGAEMTELKRGKIEYLWVKRWFRWQNVRSRERKGRRVAHATEEILAVYPIVWGACTEKRESSSRQHPHVSRSVRWGG